MVIVEAKARGIPVLASNHPGCVEAMLGVDYVLPVNPIKEYRTNPDGSWLNDLPVGIVPEQNLAPWEHALERLLTDEQTYTTVSSRSREVTQSHLSAVHTNGFEPIERFVLD